MKVFLYSYRIVLMSGAALLSALAAPIAAQETGGATATKPQEVAELGEVIVTAERRSEESSKVPVSVSAFNNQILEERIVNREQDLAELVPGLIIKSGQNSNQLSFTLRGQTLDPFSGTSPAVLTYINEAPLVAGNTSTAFFDLSSLQVLKGPQGTLFGRNATGGAVLYETTKPGDEVGGYVTLRAGDYSMYQAQGAIDLPLIDHKLLVRIAVDDNKSNGYITNVNTGNTLGDIDTKSVRLTVVAKPSEAFENTTVGQYSKIGGSEGAGGLYSYYKCGSKFNGFTLTTTMDCVYGPNSPFAPIIGNGPVAPGRWPGATAGYLEWQRQHPYDVWQSYDLPHDAHTAFLENTAKLSLSDNLSIKDIFSFGNSFARTPGILTGSPFGAIDLFNFHGLGDGPPGGETFAIDRYSNELQVQDKAFDDKLQLIAGFFFDHKNETDYIPVVVGPELPTPLADIAYYYTDRDRSEAGFAQASYKVTDAWTVTIGGRYTWEQLELNQIQGSLFELPGAPTAPSQSKKLNAPSWTLSTQYQLNADNMVYFAQRGSFRSGNYNGTVSPADNLNSFKTETTRDWELGYKFSGRVAEVPTHFNIALYQQNVDDAQHFIAALIDGNPAGFTTNVPKARVRGVELEANVRPIDWLTLGLTGAYTDAKYTDNIVNLTLQTGIPGYTIPFDSYPDSPKWSGSVYADVTLPVPESFGQVIFHVDTFGQTSSFFSSNAESITPETMLPGYSITNVRLSWNEIQRSRFSAAFYVKNAFNKLYYASGYQEGASGGFNTALWGAPRMYAGEVSFKF
jgi:iron complex outermembrane receptor protein